MEGFKKGAQVGTGVKAHGEAMGFAKGGQVNTSGEFVMKTSKQDAMDHGVQPARKGRNQAEIEAGGTKRMLPGFKKGGTAKTGKSARATKISQLMSEHGYSKSMAGKIVDGYVQVKGGKMYDKSTGKAVKGK